METQIYQHSRSPTPRGHSHLEETGLASEALAPNRWSRGTRSNEDIALESSRDTSTLAVDCQYGKDAIPSFIDSKGFQSCSNVVTTDDAQELNGEQPKVAIKRGLRGNWPKFTPHIMAVLVTVAICQLSFRNVYWMDLRPPNKLVVSSLTQGGVLNFLQLVAKLHELLILASISTIVLHAVQTYITGRSGLPIGMISNAFELGSAQFLRRKSFWEFLWSSRSYNK